MILNNLVRLFFFCSFSILFLYSCFQETAIPVIPDFEVKVYDEDYTVPATITIKNNSSGANQYLWSFEGGTPSSSSEKQPEKVIYRQAGTYLIRLEAWNDNHRESKEIHFSLDSLAALDFELQILVNDFVPAELKIVNRTKGATSYEWFFEGGDPQTSTDRNPPLICYSEPGEHTIRLKVFAGKKIHELNRSITLKPRLSVDFELIPFFDSAEMEVPWKGKLQNKTTGGLTYRWKSTGGNLKNDTSKHTELSCDQAGEYHVTLEADNGKETQSKSLKFKLLQNTNLLTMKQIHLGINANKGLPNFIASKLRKAIPEAELTEENGHLIDLAFFSLNESFNYCRFLSPDQVSDFIYHPIPTSTKTYLINVLEKSKIQFSTTDFDAMKNDLPLRKLSVRPNDTGNLYFKSDVSPRIVMFETEDGRKGAIKILRFVTDPFGSYIEVDVKIQKEKRN